MKFHLLILALFPMLAFAQENIATLNAHNVSGMLSGEGPTQLNGYIDVKNFTDETLEVYCRYSEVQTEVSSYTYKFCWNQCFGTSTIISPVFNTLEPNQTIFGSFGHLYDGNGEPVTNSSGDTLLIQGFAGYYQSEEVGATIIRHTFYDSNNTYVAHKNISYCFGNDDVAACESFNSIEETSEESFYMSTPYPNPVEGNSVRLDYFVNGSDQTSVRVVNSLGQQVEINQLSSNRGTAIINTEDFSAGIYSISLVSKGQALKTERLIIK